MKKHRLPRLSRGGKILRNLAVVGLLLVFGWGCVDFPIRDPYRSFRRAEQGELVGPSEYQGDFRTTRDVWAIGTYREQVLLHEEDMVGFECWPRSQSGPTLVPVPESRLMEGEAWFVAVDVPEGAASARLELEMSCYYTEQRRTTGYGRQICATLDVPGGQWQYGTPQLWEKTYSVDGVFLEEGGVLFHVLPESEDDQDVEWNLLGRLYEWETYEPREAAYRAMNCFAEAVFYDEMGTELGRAALGTSDG